MTIAPGAAAAAAAGSAGPAEPKGGSEGEGFSEKQATEIAGIVRSTIGMKEGQDIPTMLTGAVKHHTREALGMKQDDDPKTYFTNMFTDAAKTIIESATPPVPPAKKPSPDGERVQNLESEVVVLKKIANELTSERDAAQTRAVEEVRAGKIREALGAHDVRIEAIGLVTQNFIAGAQGINPSVNEAGALIVDGGNGSPQPFDAYLKSYFDENIYLLKSHRASGTGLAGRNSGGDGSPGAYDPKTVTARDGVDQFAKAHKEDPEATMKALAEATAAREAKYFGSAK